MSDRALMKDEEEKAVRRSSWAALGLAALSAIVSGLCGGPLAWDGAYYLFKILDEGRPFAVGYRSTTAPLHWAVLAARRLTQDLAALRVVFGLAYALLPLLCLALCWLVVRRRKPQLFLWAVLAIGPGMLAGRLAYPSEALTALDWCWPIVLLVLVRRVDRIVPAVLVAIFAALIFNLHPMAAPLMVMWAGLIGLRAWRTRERSVWTWVLGAGLVVAAGARMALVSTAYEKGALTLGTVKHFTRLSLWGWAGVGLGCTLLAGLLLVVGRKLPRWLPHALALAGAIAFLLWASDPTRWAQALAFRAPALFCVAPFAIFAAYETLWGEGRTGWRRGGFLILVAAGAALALSVQTLAWKRLTVRFSETIEASPSLCMDASEIGWLRGLPLDHWSSAALSVVLQERKPRRLVLTVQKCSEAVAGEQLRLVDWELRSRQGGWFDLREVGRADKAP